MRQAMIKHVLDASAVTAVLRNESGQENVLPHLRGSLISSVNLAEVYCKARSHGSDPEFDEMALASMQLEVIPFDVQQARVVSGIYLKTLGSSVGLADRICLALGLLRNLPVLTGDHQWLHHDIGVEVKLFRRNQLAEGK